MKKYTHLVWDFNGTLFDDVEAGIRSANRLLSAHGLAPIPSVARYRELFGFPIIDYYRRLGFDFERTPYADLAVEWVAYYLEASADSRLYPDVPQALEEAKRRGLCQMVLSATERGMLERQICSLGIRDRFCELLGLDNVRAYSKEEIALQWKMKHPAAQLLLLGDTDHDAQVAAAIGADCILVARGHQSRKALEALDVLAVADSLAEAFERIP